MGVTHKIKVDYFAILLPDENNYSRGISIPVILMIVRIYHKTPSRFVYASQGKIGNAFKPIQAIVSVSHTVKFSRASIGQILSSLLKSSEKEFTLIQSTTYCIE